MTGQWIFPIANVIFKGSMGIFADYKVVGRENIPTRGPLIVVSNHLANIDPAIVASALNRPLLFMAKKELFSNPMMRFLLAGYGVHPLDRTGADLRALNRAKSQLTVEGRVIILFPEGTRSRNQILQSGKPGVAHLASITGAPIVPFGLAGTSKLQGIVGVLRPTGTLTLNIGAPFRIVQDDDTPARRLLMSATNEIMRRIAALIPEGQPRQIRRERWRAIQVYAGPLRAKCSGLMENPLIRLVGVIVNSVQATPQ